MADVVQMKEEIDRKDWMFSDILATPGLLCTCAKKGKLAYRVI